VRICRIRHHRQPVKPRIRLHQHPPQAAIFTIIYDTDDFFHHTGYVSWVSWPFSLAGPCHEQSIVLKAGSEGTNTWLFGAIELVATPFFSFHGRFFGSETGLHCG
jgi:hypothetical protein